MSGGKVRALVLVREPASSSLTTPDRHTSVVEEGEGAACSTYGHAELGAEIACRRNEIAG